jgi:hypothetical protein
MTAMDEMTVIFDEQRTHRSGVANRLVGSAHKAGRRWSDVAGAPRPARCRLGTSATSSLIIFEGFMAPLEYRRQSHLAKVDIVDLTPEPGLWSSFVVTEGS